MKWKLITKICVMKYCRWNFNIMKRYENCCEKKNIFVMNFYTYQKRNDEMSLCWFLRTEFFKKSSLVYLQMQNSYGTNYYISKRRLISYQQTWHLPSEATKFFSHFQPIFFFSVIFKLAFLSFVEMKCLFKLRC